MSPYTAPVRSPLRMAGTRMTGESMQRQLRRRRRSPPCCGRSGRWHGEYWLRRGKRLREDYLDVVAEHLGIDWCSALILAVDEFGGSVGHHVARECGSFQRRDNLATLRAPGTFQRVGDEQDARVIHEHFVGVELSPILNLLLERQCLRVARIEPVIAVHDVLCGFGKFLDELVGGCRASEDRINTFRSHALLLHGAGE